MRAFIGARWEIWDALECARLAGRRLLRLGGIFAESLDVAGLVGDVFATGFAFAFAVHVEALLVGAGVLGGVRQPVHCGGCSSTGLRKYVV